MIALIQLTEIVQSAPIDDAVRLVSWAFVVLMVAVGIAIAAVSVWIARIVFPEFKVMFKESVHELSSAMREGLASVDQTISNDALQRRIWEQKQEDRSLRTLIILSDQFPSGKVKADTIMGSQGDHHGRLQ